MIPYIYIEQIKKIKIEYISTGLFKNIFPVIFKIKYVAKVSEAKAESISKEENSSDTY